MREKSTTWDRRWISSRRVIVLLRKRLLTALSVCARRSSYCLGHANSATNRHVAGLVTGDARNGGFQLYSVASSKITAILPDSITYAAGSVLPLATDTALVGLISSGGKGLGLPAPSLDPKPSGKTIVVWGGSSSVGTLTIQLAVAAGAKVIATAGSHNFDFVKEVGATEVIDYKKSTVVDDVVQAVKSGGGDFVGVYDAISLPDQSCKLFTNCPELFLPKPNRGGKSSRLTKQR